MINRNFDRRKLVAIATIALLGACKVVPGGPPAPPPPPPTSTLPADAQRHRIALLVPMTGPNAAVGQSIANAATMALLDTNAKNLRITTYDTGTGPASAAARAIADGNKLILGPLLSDEIPAISAAARPANVPVVSFSNDETRAAPGILIMGSLPGQSIARTVHHAGSQGMRRFAALVPAGEYGQRMAASLGNAVRTSGGTVIGVETYDRTAGSMAAAARRLRERGRYDAVLIADGGRISALAAPVVKAAGSATPRILGTDLWSGESAIARTPAMNGAWFSAVADTRWKQFADSYRTRFSVAPYRIATLGYDSVLLTLRVAREWKSGTVFPTARMFDSGGFLGLDGAFRFGPGGAIERALEIREVRPGGINVVSPAPARFGN